MYRGGRVKIGNKVLIGMGSKFFSGLKICSNEDVIGAGSVVIKQEYEYFHPAT